VFLKIPQKTSVKTRLAESLGKDTATDLYKNFVADILETLKNNRHNFIICFYPPHAQPEAAGWLGHTLTLTPQYGNDLGTRMSNAFADSFSEGFRHVLLIGTDFPDLPAGIFDNAFKFLPENDAVVGPAVDGGYYLIGFNANSFLPSVFDDMPWGTRNVFEKTIKVLRNKGLKVYILPKWRDIDTLEDLESFSKTYSANKSAASNTVTYLKRIGFKIRDLPIE
jgi:rSAM/selenodomain-associated transferase 1